MRPSPMRAEYQRWLNERPASMTASVAITTAMRTTEPAASCCVMWFTTPPASTGVITPISASPITSATKTASSRRYGRAKRTTRRHVPGASCFSSTARSRRIARMTCIESIDTGYLRRGQRGGGARYSIVRCGRTTLDGAGAVLGVEAGDGPQPAVLGVALGGLLVGLRPPRRCEQQRLGLGRGAPVD